MLGAEAEVNGASGTDVDGVDGSEVDGVAADPESNRRPEN